MKRIVILLLFCLFTIPSSVNAQESEMNDSYSVGTVIEIVEESKITVDGQYFYTQIVKIRDDKTDQEFEVTSGSDFQPLNENQRLDEGSQIIFSQQQIAPDESQQVINDVYRLPIIVALAIFFVGLIFIVAGKQGTFSILGMLFSLFILVTVIVPQILGGANPFLVTLLGASLTAIITMYLSHGFGRHVHIALASMLICLCIVTGLSVFVVHIGQFVGLGSEEAYFLQFGPTQGINLQGLLLAGILLGTLGILDDISLAQSAVVEQLKAVNPKMEFAELYKRAMSVGKDHVASLVNTLVFAYAGTSLPLFLLFTLYQSQPAWVVINSEMVAEELIRTLIGSIGLVLAVPITTFLSSYYVTNFKTDLSKVKQKHFGHSH